MSLKLPKGFLKLKCLTGVKHTACTQNASPALQLDKGGRPPLPDSTGLGTRRLGTQGQKDGKWVTPARLGEKHWKKCQFGVLQNGLFSRLASENPFPSGATLVAEQPSPGALSEVQATRCCLIEGRNLHQAAGHQQAPLPVWELSHPQTTQGECIGRSRWCPRDAQRTKAV